MRNRFLIDDGTTSTAQAFAYNLVPGCSTSRLARSFALEDFLGKRQPKDSCAVFDCGMHPNGSNVIQVEGQAPQ
jgi:hypothetical protein